MKSASPASPSKSKSQSKSPTPSASPSSAATGNGGDGLQGEGNYAAARRHRESVEGFVESGKVDEAALHAEPQTAEEADEMEQAERVGQSHSKGEDPALERAGKRRP